MKFDFIDECNKASAFEKWKKTTRDKPIAVNYKIVGFYQKKTNLQIIRQSSLVSSFISTSNSHHIEQTKSLSLIELSFPDGDCRIIYIDLLEKLMLVN